MDKQGCEERATSLPPQLLNLIPDEREWKARQEAGGGGRRTRAGTTDICLDAEEDKDELELKLGLPGSVKQEHGAAAGPVEKTQAVSCSELSLGCCYTPRPNLTSSTGAKRGVFYTAEAKTEGYVQRCQHREGCGNELTLAGAGMSGDRKKGCCLTPPPLSFHASVAATVHSSSSPKGRAAVPVVGWPPVRSFRRNLTNGSSSKQSPERQSDDAGDEAKPICKKRPLVKINMDGIPIGRKVDLTAYHSYQKLSSAVEELFRGFLQAQNDPSCGESGEQGAAQEKMFSGLLDGTGEYSLVYEDDDGDRMLVGDVPWTVFVSTTKRLRVMRRSELPYNLVGAGPERADC